MITLTTAAADPRADLAAYDAAITALDAAYADAARARADAEAAALSMERIEASHVLAIDGGNAETRRARLTLALADDGRHRDAHRRHQEARGRLADAERRLQVGRERCRLLRAALALAAERP